MQRTHTCSGEPVLSLLAQGIKRGAVSHAYLFTGEAGTGKRKMAFWLAQALLCLDQTQAPCGRCEQCIRAESGNNPDLNRFALTDLSSKKSIGADDIRAVIADAYIKPFGARYKVYIIEDGDALTPAAQNAMLKILEEPPSYVVFIICSTNADSLLPTVVSRSRVVRFAACGGADIDRYVAQSYPALAHMSGFIAAYSQGSPQRADALCRNSALLDLRSEVCGWLCELLVGGDEKRVFELAQLFDRLKKDKDMPDLTDVAFDLMFTQLGDMLKLKKGIGACLINPDLADTLRCAAKRVSEKKIVYAQSRLMAAEQMLRRAVNLRALMLNFVINVWHFSD